MKLLKLAPWLIIALWAVPVVRWARFTEWAAEYYADTESMTASNDLSYAKSIGLAYLGGIGSSVLLCWRVNRQRAAVNWTMWALGLGVLAWVTQIAPEEPIVLFPIFSPLRCGLWFAGLGAVALAAWFDDERRSDSTINPQKP